MGCICESSYTILINGPPTSWFQSTMGLQQGEPLSTYLFILGSEELARISNREQGNGKLTRQPLDDGQRYLGRLLYVDDCLMVAKASIAEACAVGNVLQEYGLK